MTKLIESTYQFMIFNIKTMILDKENKKTCFLAMRSMVDFAEQP
jgi:hypothetical protein